MTVPHVKRTRTRSRRRRGDSGSHLFHNCGAYPLRPFSAYTISVCCFTRKQLPAHFIQKAVWERMNKPEQLQLLARSSQPHVYRKDLVNLLLSARPSRSDSASNSSMPTTLPPDWLFEPTSCFFGTMRHAILFGRAAGCVSTRAHIACFRLAVQVTCPVANWTFSILIQKPGPLHTKWIPPPPAPRSISNTLGI